MCLIAFRWDPGHATPLVVAANRDEFYARAASPADWWEGGRILAGRDLQGGGTWMGVSRDGRFAALTNIREPARFDPAAPSRGALVVDFLAGSERAGDYLARLLPQADGYNGFNLLVYDGADVLGLESRARRVVALAPGVHGVSNAAFDTPWPKVAALAAAMAGDPDDAALFAALSDPRVAPDPDLPATGVPLEWERSLSAAFIRRPDYGTRASTLVRVGRAEVQFTERRFEAGCPAGERRFTFAPCQFQ